MKASSVEGDKSVVIMLEAFHSAFAQVVELHDLRSCPSHMKAAGDCYWTVSCVLILNYICQLMISLEGWCNEESRVKISGSINDI